MNVKLAGRVRCVINKGTNREVRTPWFNNLITDPGLDRLGLAYPPAILDWGCVGTGTTPPTNDDTSLQAFVASVAGNDWSGSNWHSTPYPMVTATSFEYELGAVVGVIAEVGVGWADDGTGLWCRALILDGEGDAVPLTLTALDQLTVYYTLFMYPSLDDITGSVSISGVGSRTYTGRAAGIGLSVQNFRSRINDSVSGFHWGHLGGSGTGGIVALYPAASTLGAITGTPSGSASTTGDDGSNAILASYTAGTFYRDTTILASIGAPAGGVGCVMVGYANLLWYQYQFNTPVPKSSGQTLSLTFRFSWGRGAVPTQFTATYREAVQITVPHSAAGTLANQQLLWFKFQLTDAQVLTVDAVGDGYDMRVMLFDEVGTYLNDNYGDGVLVTDAMPAGWYYIAVAGYYPFYPGDGFHVGMAAGATFGNFGDFTIDVTAAP